MLDIICWKWRPQAGYRSQFAARHVNTLRSMVARHYRKPHRFSCITDDAKGIDGDVRIIPLWDDWASVGSPHGRGQPSCYRRLKAWSAEAADIIGPEFVSVDLDCVITGDVSPVWDRPESCVLWADSLNAQNPYNGSQWKLRAGSHAHVWDDFIGAECTAIPRVCGYFGSDQAWYAYKLGPNMPRWTRADGVYSWRVHMAPYAFGGIPRKPTPEESRAMRSGGPPPDMRNALDGRLPKAARIVFFHGQWDPWNPQLLERFSWIKENYK